MQIGDKVILVPYTIHHVPIYHSWMERPDIQELTCSEPLSMEEEYEMQKRWEQEEDKCTFMVLDRSLPPGPDTVGVDSAGMAGDINLFLNDPDDLQAAEIDIMICEEACRRKGLALEALRLMMFYGATKLGIRRFIAKILDYNDASIRLFERLGYKKIKEVKVFNEVVYEFVVEEPEEKKAEQGSMVNEAVALSALSLAEVSVRIERYKKEQMKEQEDAAPSS